jgi:hypothetical protein
VAVQELRPLGKQRRQREDNIRMLYDLELSRRLNLVKSSRAISRIKVKGKGKGKDKAVPVL